MSFLYATPKSRTRAPFSAFLCWVSALAWLTPVTSVQFVAISSPVRKGRQEKFRTEAPMGLTSGNSRDVEPSRNCNIPVSAM